SIPRWSASCSWGYCWPRWCFGCVDAANAPPQRTQGTRRTKPFLFRLDPPCPLCPPWSLVLARCRWCRRRHKLLEPLPVGVRRVHRSLRVDDNAVDPVELARTPALLPPRRENLAVFQLELLDALVLVIGDPPDA